VKLGEEMSPFGSSLLAEAGRSRGAWNVNEGGRGRHCVPDIGATMGQTMGGR